MSNIAIVGAGKVGSVLGRVLMEGGEKIVCVVSRSLKSARAAGRFLGCRNCADSLKAIPTSTDVILIAAPHSVIAGVADSLSQLDHLRFSRLAVCHTSGMLAVDVLDAVKKKGATVFSFHPLQTFPRDFPPKRIVPTARGIYYAVDGTTSAVRKARLLAHKLKGKIIEIKPEKRPFYHAACVVASNHLTALLSILEIMSGQLGLKKHEFITVFKPIILATFHNVEVSSPREALSGPVARGGVETITGHFEAVRQFAPELLSYFGTLTLETVRLAEAKGSITASQASSLRQVVRSQSNLQSEEIH